ncbi:hypothetical protein Tco_0307955 [Tanacetum coccineum]
MSNPKFAEIHNLVAFLKKPEESDGFEGIIDFLNASFIKYALTVNPTIYTTCIEQFWATAKAKIVNGERQIQALVDKKKVIITEKSVRSNLMLEDVEGTYYLPNATIFLELERMGDENLTQKLTFYKAYFSSQWKFLIHTILQCLSAKTTAWNEFSSTMAYVIICLDTNQKFNFSKYIFDSMVKNLEGGVKFLMYPRKGFSGRVTPLFQTMIVQAPEDMGEDSAAPTDSHPTSIITQPLSSKPQKKQSRRKQRKGNGPTKLIPNEATSEEHLPTHSNDPLLSGKDRLQLNELMEICTNLQKKVLDLETSKAAQAQKISSLKQRVKKLERKKKSRPHGLRRLYQVSSSRRVESSEGSLGAQEDASKQGRKIDDLDAEAEVTLIDETQGRNNEDLVFDTGVLDGDEVFKEPIVNAATTTSSIPVSAGNPVTTVGEVVTTASVEIPDKLTLAQTLIEIKSKKPTIAATTVTPAITRTRAKGIIFHDQEEQAHVSTPIDSPT